MSLSLQQIRDKILRATGTVLGDWPNGVTDLDLYANLSWWDIMDQFDFREKEAPISTFLTVMSQRQYDLPTSIPTFVLDAVQRVAIVDPDTGKHTDLILVSDFTYENQYIDITVQADALAKPTRYFRRGSSIIFYETPDQAYTIVVYALAILSDIPSQGPVVPQSWHEAITQGAIWRAFADLGDESKLRMWMSLQAASINGRTPVKVKELADTKLAGVEVPGRCYP